MKKLRTLIVIDNLNTGGVATSLYNFLQYAQDFMDIDLIVFDIQSIDYSRIPDSVKILKCDSKLSILGVSQKDTFYRSFFDSLKRLFYVLISRIINGEFARSILLSKVEKLESYDLAISYAQDNAWRSLSKGCLDYVVKNVVSKRKATFIHCDYSNFGGYDKRQEKILSQLDDIICVSESCKISFARMFPSLREKCIVIENFINTKQVVSMSKAFNTGFENEDYFVTVCRLSEEKGLLRTINIWKCLTSVNVGNYKWLIVGDGPERKKIEEAIRESHLESSVILVGNQHNPYPYIRNAKLFVLVSFHEAAPMVFGESVTLGVPVFTTATCSAIEIIESRGWGVVVPNNERGIHDGLSTILKYRQIPVIEPQLDKVNYMAIAQLKAYLNRIYGRDI